MWIYSALLLLPLGWWAADRWSIASRSQVALALFIVLTSFIGLRYHVGGDWYAYWLMYDRAQSHSPATALLISDPAYMALNLIAARLGLSIAFVNLACAMIVAAGISLFSRSQPRPWLTLLVATPMLIAVVAMNTTRQSAAIGLELIALTSFLRGSWRQGSILLLLACAFHSSAALLLPMIVLLRIDGRRRALFIAGGIALASATAAGFWVILGDNPFEDPAIGAAIRLLLSLLAAAALALGPGRLVLDRVGWAIALYLAGLTLFCILLWPVSSMASDRLGLYTIALQMLVLPRLAGAVRSAALRPVATAATIGLYLTFFAGWWLLSSFPDVMLPYRSYLQDPGLLIGDEPLKPAI